MLYSFFVSFLPFSAALFEKRRRWDTCYFDNYLFVLIDYLAGLSYAVNIKNPPRQAEEDSYSFNPNFLNLLTFIQQLLLQELLLPEQLLPLRVR